ncbi:MAG: MFS transporter [Melioribacteraceae bacterium]|jgi:NNP family nitrate/nitrite transporter-like MFS transporter|nr:MFS transporter [Melioribacteraceae bacterium]WKZ70076.1 MAG: MFS transporter [Melioribacteraceae bacterium]
MVEKATGKSYQILFMNTFAFTICFAAWTINGVLVTFLVDTGTFNWSSVEVGWLLGIPILSGSIFRFPIGMLTDKFGGKIVFSTILFFCSIPLFLLAYANSFTIFALLSFLFGLTGASFASGIAFTSLWFPKSKQGTALGIFGVGTAGTALTALIAPSLLDFLTDNGAHVEGWRILPQIYATVLILMGILFIFFTKNKLPEKTKSFKELFHPLKNIRLWRFGLYYFLVFGCFVAFSQWLVPYYVNAYYLSLVTAGFLTSLFSMPAGLFRALGGWLADKFGARRVMYGVFSASIILSFLLIFPRMEIYSPGYGVTANQSGEITDVNENYIEIEGERLELTPKDAESYHEDKNMLVLPRIEAWHEPVVSTGEEVKRKELVARGVTRIFFQANVWIFSGLVFLIGVAWGIGMGGVYKFIPEYFPNEVGVVGGAVGVLGGLGGFFFPIVFGYALSFTGIWTSSWFLMLLLSLICFAWFHSVVTKMLNSKSPELISKFESAG